MLIYDDAYRLGNDFHFATRSAVYLVKTDSLTSPPLLVDSFTSPPLLVDSLTSPPLLVERVTLPRAPRCTVAGGACGPLKKLICWADTAAGIKGSRWASDKEWRSAF